MAGLSRFCCMTSTLQPERQTIGEAGITKDKSDPIMLKLFLQDDLQGPNHKVAWNLEAIP